MTRPLTAAEELAAYQLELCGDARVSAHRWSSSIDHVRRAIETADLLLTAMYYITATREERIAVAKLLLDRDAELARREGE